MNIRYPIYEGVYRILTLHRTYRFSGVRFLDCGGLPAHPKPKKIFFAAPAFRRNQ